MKDTVEIFSRRRVNVEKLLPYGFQQDDGGYLYQADLVKGQFKMTVVVSPEGAVTTAVVDASTGEDYVLHRVAATVGEFVGKVREEYEQVLIHIADTCFTSDVFKSQMAKQIIQFVRDKYHSELEFLWPRTPDNAIFRRVDNAKWYGAILTVSGKTLGLDDASRLEILNVRMRPDDVVALTDGKKYFPGYHMNKKHWVTLRLDGSVPIEEILMRIDDSFGLVGA